MSHYKTLYKIDHGLSAPESVASNIEDTAAEEKKISITMSKFNPFSKKKVKAPPPPIKLQPVSPAELGFQSFTKKAQIIDNGPKSSLVGEKSSYFDFEGIPRRKNGSLGSLTEFPNTITNISSNRMPSFETLVDDKSLVPPMSSTTGFIQYTSPRQAPKPPTTEYQETKLQYNLPNSFKISPSNGSLTNHLASSNQNGFLPPIRPISSFPSEFSLEALNSSISSTNSIPSVPSVPDISPRVNQENLFVRPNPTVHGLPSSPRITRKMIQQQSPPQSLELSTPRAAGFQVDGISSISSQTSVNNDPTQRYRTSPDSLSTTWTERTHLKSPVSKRSDETFGMNNLQLNSPEDPSLTSRGVRLGQQMIATSKHRTPFTGVWTESDQLGENEQRFQGAGHRRASRVHMSVEQVNSRAASWKRLTLRMHSQKTQIQRKKLSKLNGMKWDTNHTTYLDSRSEAGRLSGTPSLMDDTSSLSSFDEIAALSDDFEDEEELLDEMDDFLDLYAGQTIEGNSNTRRSPRGRNRSEFVPSSKTRENEVPSRESNIRSRKQGLIEKITMIRTLSRKVSDDHVRSQEEQEWEDTLHMLEEELYNLEEERLLYLDSDDYVDNKTFIPEPEPVRPLNIEKHNNGLEKSDRMDNGDKKSTTLKSYVEQEYISARKANLMTLYHEDVSENVLVGNGEVTIIRNNSPVFKGDLRTFQTNSSLISPRRESADSMIFNAPLFQ